MRDPISANDPLNDTKELLRFVADLATGSAVRAALDARAAFANVADVTVELRSRDPELWLGLVAWAMTELGLHKKTADAQVQSLLKLATQLRATWAVFADAAVTVGALATAVPVAPSLNPTELARAEAASRVTTHDSGDIS